MKLTINYRKLLKRIGIFLISIILLLTILLFSLRLPAFQNFIKDRLIVYLEKKIKTKVSLEKVYVGFPNSLVIENLYLKGQDVDTLLSVRKFDVGLDMWQLLKSKADLTSIDLEGVRANVVRNPKGKFNFDYIINAFATSEKEESTSKPFIISLDKIILKDIGITFDDQQAKNDINVYFKSFNTTVKTFDLQNNKYAINNIDLDGLKLKLKQNLIEEVAKNVDQKVDSLNQQKPMDIDLNSVKFTNFNIDYGDDITKTFAKIIFKELSTNINDIDLQNNIYDIAGIKLHGAKINANLNLPSTQKTSSAKTESSSNNSKESPMKVLLGKLTLSNVQAVYNNTAIAPTRSGMDFNHLDFPELKLDLRNFKMENNQFSGKVISAEIQEKRGLNIEEFTTEFVYADKEASLKNLYLQTPKTILRDEIVLNYNSIEQLTANPGAVKISADIRDSKIGFSDILNLVPSLKNTAPFNKYPNAILKVNTFVRGSINDLAIQNLKVSGLDDLKVYASGKIKNAMNPENLYYDLNVTEFSTSSKTIYNLVPKNTIPSNITLPSFFTIRGSAKGTTQLVDTNLRLTDWSFARLRTKYTETFN